MPSSRHATLTILVAYNTSLCLTPQKAEEEIRWVLGRLATHAADQGLLSGDTDLIVDTWVDKVEVHPCAQ